MMNVNTPKMPDVTVQELLEKHLMSVDGSESNETLQLMTFLRDEGVPLTNHQAAAIFLLQDNGITDLANYIVNVRRHMTPFARFMKLIDKLTLADRIKGNAKLSGILKANANPANGAQLNSGKEPK